MATAPYSAVSSLLNGSPMRHLHPTYPLPRAGCAGLSLTELLVATTLLALATAGGLTGFARAQMARRDAGQLQQLHERAQYAFASLEPELQLAGYFGNSAPPGPLSPLDIPDAAQRCGVDVIRRLDRPLQAENGWTFNCPPNGHGAVAGSDVLVVRRVSARAATAPEPGRAQWLSRLGKSRGDLYWMGDAPWSAGVPGEELRELIVRIYYVAQAADGDAAMPALRVKSLTSIAGVPAFIDTEVMQGVERLQVELLPSSTHPQAVRVQLRIRGDAGGVRAPALPPALDVTRHFALRNAAG